MHVTNICYGTLQQPSSYIFARRCNQVLVPYTYTYSYPFTKKIQSTNTIHHFVSKIGVTEDSLTAHVILFLPERHETFDRRAYGALQAWHHPRNIVLVVLQRRYTTAPPACRQTALESDEIKACAKESVPLVSADQRGSDKYRRMHFVVSGG